MTVEEIVDICNSRAEILLDTNVLCQGFATSTIAPNNSSNECGGDHLIFKYTLYTQISIN